jgi:polysaccharide export outer membrane protein
MSARPLVALAATLLALAPATCASAPEAPPPQPAWTEALPAEGPYLLAPGDRIEVIVHTAPELSGEFLIAPDGRLRMPLAGPVTATALTSEELAATLAAALAGELIDPSLEVNLTEPASQKIFIGGEVRAPGMFDLPGQIYPLQAIVMAGGLTRDAAPKDVLLIRRLPGGEVRSAVINVKAGLTDPALASWLPLRRFDVVYVPRSRISEQNQFVQQILRTALPLPFMVFYDVSASR